MIDFFKRTARIRQFYYNSMMSIYNSLMAQAGNNENPLVIIKVLDELAKTYEFEQYISHLAKETIAKVAIENAKNWREAFKESYKPTEFYKTLLENTQGQIQGTLINKTLENAELIRTMPRLWASKATQVVMEETLKGRRASDIKKDIINLYGDISEASAQRIARTEISKTNALLTQTRSQAIGADWYIWKTAKDQRVRNSHEHMEGVLCNYNNPPNPEILDKQNRSYGVYNAGSIFNCRCYSAPLLDIRDVSFPARVHLNGQIIKVTKNEFMKVM